MIEGSLARRYAKALLELGQEAGKADLFGTQLAAFVALLLANDSQLHAAMTNPSLTAAERKSVLEALIPRMAFDPMMVNFLRLVLEKERFAALPAISREYRSLADVLANRVRATVTTAAPASLALQSEIARALSSATGKTVVVQAEVDPSLLGGLVARVGGRVFDASLRTRLESLQVTLATTALG
jgi:F-type H+-transporting ATPase subunit delta